MANEDDDDLIPTRASLLGRLKNSKDQASWQEFFDTYWTFIYRVARKAGLNDDEAKDVLQATMDSVAERLATFKYTPKVDSFKAWLQQIIRLQIISRTLKHRPASSATSKETIVAGSDPSGKALDQLLDTEWRTNLLRAAVTNVKRRLDPKKYQIYDLQVSKQWPAEKVMSLMGVSVHEVISAKQDITQMIQAEVKRLEEKMV